MTQKIAYELLKELGGRAKGSDIIRLVRERYPKDSYHRNGHIISRLGLLKRWGIIDHDYQGYWSIKRTFEGGEL